MLFRFDVFGAFRKAKFLLPFVKDFSVKVGLVFTKKLGAALSPDEHWRMDWVQIHLALNHIPVIGLPILVVMLIAGWWRKSNEVIRLALWSLLSLAGAAIAIKFTGDFAAEQSAQQFASVQTFVTRHEEAGDRVTTAVFFLGLSVALALFLARRGRPVPRWILILVVLAGLVTGLLYVWSAHTGGQISHPELREKSSLNSIAPPRPLRLQTSRLEDSSSLRGALFNAVAIQRAPN